MMFSHICCSPYMIFTGVIFQRMLQILYIYIIIKNVNNYKYNIVYINLMGLYIK